VLDRAQAGIESFLERGVQKGKTTEEQRAKCLANLKFTLDLPFALEDSDLVIEAVPEDVSLKNELFQQCAMLAGDGAVLATNTSSLSLAEVFAGVKGPERCIGTHFFNPPPIMPLIEIVRTDNTSLDTCDRVERLAKQLGKEPILVRDTPGFATSRLGVVLGLEAIRMVETGVAEPQDIDKAMELGYRHPMGPLRLTDLVGLDVRMAIAEYLDDRLDSPAFKVPELMRKMVAEGKLGKKSGQGFYKWD
jgi:3-hydroxybutyryl-CoA dehydrogenase